MGKTAVNAEQLIDAFRKNGMKVTPQRRLLCQLIETADDHPTVESLHHRASLQMPTMSLKTVYTTLTDLAELGVIRLSSFGSGSLRVDPDPTPHAHLVCKTCGQVIDEPLSAIGNAPTLTVKRDDFTIEEQELVFRGRCKRCHPAPNKEAEPFGDA